MGECLQGDAHADEVTVDFIRLDPHEPTGVVVARITCSPKFLRDLIDDLERVWQIGCGARNHGTKGYDVKDPGGGEFLYHESDFVVSSSTIGKKLSPEHEAILRRVRRRQLEDAVKRSNERRRKWGLPELGYRPPTA